MTTDANPSDGIDAFFGFLVGLYAAALVAPVVTMGVALRVTTEASLLYLTLLGSVTAVVAVVGVAARRESLAVSLGGTRWTWLAVVAPFGYLAALFAGVVVGTDLPGVVGGLAFLGALAGMLVGFGLVVAARNRYSKAVLADAETFARWSARAPERDRRIAKAGAVAVFVLGISGFVASVVFEFPPFQWVGNLLVPMAVGFIGATNERTLTVTDDGLVVKRPLNRRVRPWSAYESYSVSEDALVVHRAGRSAWGLRDVRCDIRDVGDATDVDAAEAVLAEFLLRREV